MHDPHDDHAFMAAALAAHTPQAGRITVHPTPVASAPASLAHDLLRSMGKHLPPTGSDDGTYWTGNTETAWRALAAWTLALRTGHLIVTRAHRISSRHFEYLFALRELTRIRMTLLCHGPLPPALATALATLRHEEAHTLAAAHRAFTTPAPPPPTSRFAWWEAGEQFPPREGEPCFLLPTRRTPGRGVIEAAARRLGRTVLPLPAARCFPYQPDEPTALLAHRLHTRIAHPVHAAALAVRVFTGCPATQLQLPAAHTAPPALPNHGPEHPTPTWAADLIEAARCFGQLEGRQYGARPLRLSPWDQTAVTEAAHACGLHEHQAPAAKRHSAATTLRSGRPPLSAARAADPRRAGRHEAGKRPTGAPKRSPWRNPDPIWRDRPASPCLCLACWIRGVVGPLPGHLRDRRRPTHRLLTSEPRRTPVSLGSRSLTRMVLSNDERELLKLVAQAGRPVWMSEYFPVLNPAEPGMDENHPGYEAWTERQMAWYGISISLWKRGLVRVVAPADGSRGDLVEPTGEGRAALAAADA
ncbi:hypothetical protein ACIQ9I_37475 [Streptomyces sp. NPDC094461]|uniref:hypothetical protein n=1 Tax=Streptomyces sp. NPDC094461 TaxID=3366064 RepID=UPI00382B7CE9